MLDLDQRVADGLRELASRAPADADVWPAAERHVARHRKRRHAITGAVVAVALVGGGIATAVVVRSEPSKAVVATHSGRLPAQGPVNGAFTISVAVGGRLVFSPSNVTVKAGIYAVTLVDASNTTHSLAFDNPATLSSRGLIVSNKGQTKTARVFFGRPGTYLFYCTVPGHRAAGEQGLVHVTGPAITLAQAISAGRR
jgi:plastocyanin